MYTLSGIMGLTKTNQLRSLLHPSSIIYLTALDLCILAVSFGSASFHAMPCFFTQLLDEFPMVVLAQLYVAALLNAKDHLMRSDGDGGNHSSNLTIYVITVNALITLTALCVYIVYEAFEIFVHLFTLLITIVVVVAGMVVRQGHREVGRGKMSKVVIEAAPSLYMSVLLILLGRMFWEFERSIYTSQTCPYSAFSPSFWLHPLWHTASAAAHMKLVDFCRHISIHATPPAQSTAGSVGSKLERVKVEPQSAINDRAYVRSRLSQ